jgi:hypothetical protein
MGENHFFISYSRKQLYFAEALSLALQKEGLKVWMDLQRLEPGSDWQDQIDDGLRNCAGLILVASKQSFASPFVESEWRAVMDSGKPVYIAYYEEVDLPPALDSAALVDLRGSFKKGVGVLAAALKNMSSVREKVPPPNRLGLPQKMPLMIMLVAGAMVIGALFFPLQLHFTEHLSQFALLTVSFLGTGSYLLMAWRFIHHKLAISASRWALWLLVSFFIFPAPERLELVPGIGWWMSTCLPIVFLGIAIYLLPKSRLGAELLRWSAPGGDDGVDVLRRRFNKSPIAKDKPVQVVRHQVLTARNSEPKDSTAVEPQRSTPTIRPVEEGTQTYSLHYASADSPVAASLRRELGAESLQEVNSNAQTQIVILSENLPRSKLQEFLDSGQLFVPILIGNLAFEGDSLLERAASLQLIDYRNRSRPILTALARTLKESADGNLPVGFETNPQPLNSTVLPQPVLVMCLAVFNMCGWLILSGLVSLTRSFLGMEPIARSGLALNFVGMVCGLIWIKSGNAYLLRKTTDFRILPLLLFSTCLMPPIYLGSMFVTAQALATNAHLDWAITLSLLFTHPIYQFCLLCPGGLVGLWTGIVWWRYLGDWLPAFISSPEQQDRFKPLVVIQNKYLIWRVLLFGTLSTFGMPTTMYILITLLGRRP